MKDAPRQQFRSAAHVSGTASVKLKDYEAAAEVEAENEYAAWALLRNTESPLHVGDLLETIPAEAAVSETIVAPESFADAPVKAANPAKNVSPVALYTGKLRICKYVGFEDARWFVPEPTQASFPLPAPVTPFPAVAHASDAPPAPAPEGQQAQA